MENEKTMQNKVKEQEGIIEKQKQELINAAQ